MIFIQDLGHLCELFRNLDQFSIALHGQDEEIEMLHVERHWNRYRMEKMYELRGGMSFTHWQLVRHITRNMPDRIDSIEIIDEESGERFSTDTFFKDSLKSYRETISQTQCEL